MNSFPNALISHVTCPALTLRLSCVSACQVAAMDDCDLRLQDAGWELSSDQCFSFMKGTKYRAWARQGRTALYKL